MIKQYYKNLRRLSLLLWSLIRSGITSERVQHYRTVLFLGYIVVALLAFIALALLANTTPYFRFDLHTTRELQGDLPTWFRYAMLAISWPGYPIQAAAIVLIISGFLAFIRLRWEALCTLFAVVSTTSLNYVVKIIVHRPRPSAKLVEVVTKLSSYSFPSGHVMFFTAFFGFLLFLVFIYLKKSLQRTLLFLFLIFLILAVGVSRVYLGEHWASDVIGGYLLGSLDLILAIQFYRWGKKKHFKITQIVPESEENK